MVFNLIMNGMQILDNMSNVIDKTNRKDEKTQSNKHTRKRGETTQRNTKEKTKGKKTQNREIRREKSFQIQFSNSSLLISIHAERNLCSRNNQL